MQMIKKKQPSWLINMMFKEHLGRTMEVYIDDMLVKSEKSNDHISNLKQSFDILRKYHMKLNPTKCSFGIRAGKFLWYMVTRRGIEANPDQIKVIIQIKSPKNLKEVQRLTGRVAALNRFISRSSDKCHLFYNVLRKNKIRLDGESRACITSFKRVHDVSSAII